MQAGDRIGDRYTVVGTLGTGGMGTVYEVQADALGNRLAMKVMSRELSAHPTVLQRFRQEARLQATMSHPGICRVFDLVDHDGLLAIVMELVPSPTLRQCMDAGRLPEGTVRAVLTEVLATLHACHEQGVVHRDLKPENIFVIEDPAGPVRCKLADFGVAKDMQRDGRDNLTRTSAFVGTYLYASPEQIAASAKVDARSDLYSVGVILWEMLAGVPPYADLDSAYSVQVAVVTEDLPMLPPQVALDLRRLVAELTRKQPEERPASALEAAGLLRDGAKAVQGATGPLRIDPGRAATVAAGVVLGDVAAPAAAVPANAEPTPQAQAPATPAAAASASRAVTAWDPGPEQAASADVAARRVRRAEIERLRDERLRSLRTPDLRLRLWARLVDELLLQLLVLSCVGIIIYPVAAILRGAPKGRSAGSRTVGIGVYVDRNGLPASFGSMVVRNAVDLVIFQGGLVLTLWPIGWGVGVPFVGIPWFIAGILVEIVVAASHPEGRRLADLIAGTRVSVRP